MVTEEENLTASHLYSYYQPSQCGRRIYLQHLSVPEAEPSPYEQVLLELGERHEKAYLSTLEKVEDISSVSFANRISLTRSLIESRASIIYQPALRAESIWGSTRRTISGEPDFIVLKGDSYTIRDCKISRRINDKDHPEILRQLELYGWLFEETVGHSPAGLEVVSGTGEIVEVPYYGGGDALEVLHTVDHFQKIPEEPYNPVGWSNCRPCGYFERCWNMAESSNDLALVPEVDKGLVNELRSRGVKTIEELAGLDEGFLFELKRPWGKRVQKVGKKATTIIRQAKAIVEGRELVIGKLPLPATDNIVVFDVEGLPPHLDESDKVYLWGLKVFGTRVSSYMPALAEFGADGDRNGWLGFLENCSKIFSLYGDLPFIHWSAYEGSKVRTYIERYGDPEGVAARVQGNLIDLLKVTKDAIVLPDYSYGLKRVEKLAGYKRSLPEATGDWSMAKYIEATETQDPVQRQRVMNEILEYNREDLEATWAVLQWLKRKLI